MWGNYSTLSESAHYAFTYGDGKFNPEAAVSLANANNMGAGLIAPFKILSRMPDAQKRLLENVVDSIGGEEGYAKTEKAILNFFYDISEKTKHSDGRTLKKEFAGLEENISTSEANIRRMIVIYSPETVEAACRAVADEIFYREDKPVIKANSGMVALKQLIGTLDNENEFYIITPNRLNNHELIGYIVRRNNDGLSVDDLGHSYDFGKGGLTVVRFTNHNLQDDEVAAFLRKGTPNGNVSVASIENMCLGMSKKN